MSTLQAGHSDMSISDRYAGTPYFMPPERIVNFKYVKPVADVWSFAATLCHLLTGNFPYRRTILRPPNKIRRATLLKGSTHNRTSIDLIR